MALWYTRCIKKNKIKLLIYKSLFIFFFIFVLFQLTFGLIIKDVKETIYNLGSKENSETLKVKIKEEIKSSLKKDRIIQVEDAALIKAFIEKIKKELN